MSEPKPKSEEEKRLSKLNSYRVLDTPAEESFDRITRLASRMFNAPIALVSLVDKDRQWFKSKHGISAEETSREIAFCSHAILQEGVFHVQDATQDSRFSENPLVTDDPNIRFYAGAPLTTGGGLNLGTLCIIDNTPRDFSSEDKDALCDLARMVVDELELRQLASFDALTGVLNRGRLMETGHVEFRRAARYDRSFSVIMLDADHFKNINDTYGHGIGDQVLKQLADICEASLREQDTVGRYGGEEFAILLPETDEANAFIVAQKIRKIIEQKKINVGERQLQFTISAGIAARQPASRSFDELLNQADKALYKAKETGRNKVVNWTSICEEFTNIEDVAPEPK